jgi:ABC-2 type transport system permease protein
MRRASISIAEERTKQTFQRIAAAPVSPMTVLAGKFVSSLAIVYMSATILLVSGVVLFQVNLYWDIPAIVFLTFLGSLSAIGIGLLISSLAKDMEAAISISTLIVVPLQFFIGAMFPLSDMPSSAQAFGNTLPFTKLVDAMQDIMTKGFPITEEVPEILYMTTFGLILFVLGVVAYWASLKRL